MLPVRLRSIRALALTVVGFGILCRIQAAGSFTLEREHMVEQSVAAEGVTNERVLEVMRNIPRDEFVPAQIRGFAYMDEALPIGEGQTISPPSVVGRMTQALDPHAEDRVLEIGTGSGYQAAILSRLVREVYTIEIVEPLAQRAAKTLKRLGYRNVHVLVGDGAKGAPEHAPFDKIVVTCSPENIPPALIAQLKQGGRLVIPLGQRYIQNLYLFTKEAGKLRRQSLEPTAFVPMTGEAESARTVQPDGRHPRLLNGGFEELAADGKRPAVWYHHLQLQLETSTNAPEGRRFVRFSNHSSGRQANVSQAFAVDGREVSTLEISCSVRAKEIQEDAPAYQLGALVLFFNGPDASTLDAVSVGRWHGSFDWRKWSKRVSVPREARGVILSIGLFGATGEIAFDEVAVRAVN